jgi:hypothetical protein
MSFPEGVKSWRIDKFTNAHNSFNQALKPDMSYDLFIDEPGFASLSALEKYNKCTTNLMWIINDALQKGLKIRAMGSGWSFSKVAVCDGAIINTKRLRIRIKPKPENFDPQFLAAGNSPENFKFLQCGNTVIALNQLLEQDSVPPKSIRCSGGSNGQTIVGAFSTGTHGASINVGALSEMVVGLHIITGPDRHFYIERSSRKVTSPLFHQKIGAKAIADDELFNAALVSFGSFGIIHGVMLEIEDKFLLKQKLGRIPYDSNLDAAVSGGSFDRIEAHLQFPLNDPRHKFYHFELAINPHDFGFDNLEKGVYVRTMFKCPLEQYDPIVVDPKYSYGDDTLGLMQTVLDTLEKIPGKIENAVIPKLVNALFKLAYDRPEAATGTIGETFNATKFRGQLFSAAFGIRREDVKDVILHCLEVNKSIKLAGVMAFRFVKGTSATLGFTRWENSCVLELDGADTIVNYDFMKSLSDRLFAHNIEHTIHWGKINKFLDKARLEKMYGPARIKAWRAQRSRIMTIDVQKIFNNDFMKTCGLDEFEGSSLIA